MLLAYAMTLQLAVSAEPPPSLHLLEPSARPVLLAQTSSRELQLKTEIDELNGRLRVLKVDWPIGSLIGAYIGFSGASLLLPIALTLFLVSALTGGTSVASGVFLAAVVCLVTGAVALVVAIFSVVLGFSAQEAAKTERGELIRQREAAQRELDSLRQGVTPSGGLDRERRFESLVTVAEF